MKEKYQVEIAGMTLSVVSDDGGDTNYKNYLFDMAKELDSQVMNIVLHNQRCGKTEAIMLCALNFLDERNKAMQKAKSIEKQLSGFESDLEELKRENDELKKMLQ